MKIRILGICFFVVVAAVVVFWKTSGRAEKPAVIRGYTGGEKTGFLDDPEVKTLLREKYKLQINYIKLGSLDMASADTQNIDFLFPSSSLALELYKMNGGVSKRSEDLFVSPLVIYSWDVVADALERVGAVAREGESYLLDMEKLLDLINRDTSWADIGLPQLYGQICVYSTDPVRSNSGNLLTALAAAVLNGGRPVTQGDVPGIMDPLRKFLSKSGYKESSSADLFSQYLRTGLGGKALAALYENQLIEFARQNPRDWNRIKDKVRVLYPNPTVWSSHIFIAANDKAARFLDAMRDEKLKEAAWEVHGFRTGAFGNNSPTTLMRDMGIVPEITRVIQIPDYAAMNAIMRALE
jgi:hypothetical protein